MFTFGYPKWVSPDGYNPAWCGEPQSSTATMSSTDLRNAANVLEEEAVSLRRLASSREDTQTNARPVDLCQSAFSFPNTATQSYPISPYGYDPDNYSASTRLWNMQSGPAMYGGGSGVYGSPTSQHVPQIDPALSAFPQANDDEDEGFSSKVSGGRRDVAKE
jgi:hypothetical protein